MPGSSLPRVLAHGREDGPWCGLAAAAAIVVFPVVLLQDQSAAGPGHSREHRAEPGSPSQHNPDSTDDGANCQYRDVGLGQVTTELGTVL